MNRLYSILQYSIAYVKGKNPSQSKPTPRLDALRIAWRIRVSGNQRGGEPILKFSRIIEYIQAVSFLTSRDREEAGNTSFSWVLPNTPVTPKTVILSIFAKDLASTAIDARCFAEFTLERSEGLNMTSLGGSKIHRQS